jgi:DNA-binding NtrC family response regulator
VNTASRNEVGPEILRTTILIVEDEVLVRMGIAEFLRERGYRVVEAGDAAEARSVLAADSTIGVVFTDVVMPGSMDGFALAAWVREHHPGVRVLLTSGVTGAGRLAAKLQPGALHIDKPYLYPAVADSIAQLLATGSHG